MNHEKKETEKSYVICKSCTRHLVDLCHERTWWFRYFRSPMVWGMRLMAWRHGIDPKKFEVRTENCYGCVRFMKNALKDKSPVFCWLNDRINPVFNRVRNSIVTEEEMAEAKRCAVEAMNPEGE